MPYYPATPAYLLYPGVALCDLREDATATANTNALLAVMAAGNLTVLLPPGVFPVNNVAWPANNVTLRGAGKPRPSSDRTALAGGTVLQGGTLNLNGAYNPGVLDLGVDVISLNNNAILSSSTPGTGKQAATIRNVSALGAGTGHGISLTSGDDNIVDNFDAYKFQHGIAIRANTTRLTGLYAEDCSLSCLTIKAVSPGMAAQHNVVVGVQSVGTSAAASGPIVIEGHDGQLCAYNVVADAVMKNVSRAIQLKTVDNGSGHGEVRACQVANVRASGVTYEGLLVSGAEVSSDVDGFQVYGSPTYFARNTSSSTGVRVRNATTNAPVVTGGTFDVLDIAMLSGGTYMPLFNPPQPSVLPFRVAASGQAWAVPLAATEFAASTSVRGVFDLTMFREIRLVAKVNGQASASAILYLEYAPDGATFVAIDGGTGTNLAVGSTGIKVSGWVSIAAAAKIANATLRVMGSGGDGATVGSFANIYAEVR